MSLQTITPTMAAALGLSRNYGVIVSDVWPGGPAEAAGMKVGDVLLQVDGQPADNLPTINYLFRLRDSPDRVQISVLRGAAQMVLSVAAVEDRNELDSVTSVTDTAKNIVRELGILGVEIDAQHRGRGHGPPQPARHHRRGPGRRRHERGAAAPERCHSDRQQQARHHLAGASRRAARVDARFAGGPADSTRGALDVRVVHAGLTIISP